jgi:hypothetical protein
MGFLDALLGRSKPKRPDLDRLFDVPSAATTLEVNGWTPTGVGSVCFRAAEGAAFSETQADAQSLIQANDGPRVEQTRDEFGFTWLTVRAEPDEPDATSSVVTGLHAVNSSLESAGFGSLLLCSIVGLTQTSPSGGTQKLALVYLYKRGTFYPFAPRAGTAQQRDNAIELNVRGLIAGDLPVEPELSRWFAVWGAPGL